MRARLLLFGYPLLEVATAYLIALWIGWGWTLLILLLGIPVGLGIMRNAGDSAMADLERASRTGEQPDAGRHALTFAGGLLIAVPGFWSDLVGLLLVLPPTQRLFRRRGRSWLETRVTTVRFPGVRYPSGDVITGTVIRRGPDNPQPDDPQPDGPQPDGPRSGTPHLP